MNIQWTSFGWEDYLYWQAMDKRILKRINALIQDIRRNPFDGLGKPEPLKHEKSGYWSRRIEQAHRILYKVSDGTLHIVQCRYHYRK